MQNWKEIAVMLLVVVAALYVKDFLDKQMAKSSVA